MKGYDVKCEALARAFLSDVDLERDDILAAELAQKIQDAIEDFFSYKEIDL